MASCDDLQAFDFVDCNQADDSTWCSRAICQPECVLSRGKVEVKPSLSSYHSLVVSVMGFNGVTGRRSQWDSIFLIYT